MKTDKIKWQKIRNEMVVEGTRLAKVLENPEGSIEEILNEQKESHTNPNLPNLCKAYFTDLLNAFEYLARIDIVSRRELLSPEKIAYYNGRFDQILLA